MASSGPQQASQQQQVQQGLQHDASACSCLLLLWCGKSTQCELMPFATTHSSAATVLEKKCDLLRKPDTIIEDGVNEIGVGPDR